VPAAGSPTGEESPDDRLRRVELENRKLTEQLRSLESRHNEQIQQLLREVDQLREQGRPSGAESGAVGNSPGSGAPVGEAPRARPGEASDIGGAADQPGGRRSPSQDNPLVPRAFRKAW
jgi:phosphate-selective porin OprO/OprP